MSVVSSPCCSAWLLQPYLTVIGADPRIPRAIQASLGELPPERRIHITHAHALLECAERMLDDEQLGLKASAAMANGDGGLLEFLISSADTLRAAIDASARFVRLLSDGYEVSLEVVDGRAMVRIESTLAFPRSVEDFALGSLLRHAAFSSQLRDDLDVWFRHAPPRDLPAFAAALGPARLHFRAGHTGFAFSSRELDAPLATRDARLHRVLLQCARSSLATLPSTASWTERVKERLHAQLGSEAVALEGVAGHFDLHPRKLTRLLRREGTTFQELLDRARRETALRLLRESEQSIADIAARTGFTGKAPFHRAFRRWTSSTPGDYRRTQRGDVRGVRQRVARAS